MQNCKNKEVYFWNWEHESHTSFVMILTEEQLQTTQITVYQIVLLKGLMDKSWKYKKKKKRFFFDSLFCTYIALKIHFGLRSMLCYTAEGSKIPSTISIVHIL